MTILIATRSLECSVLSAWGLSGWAGRCWLHFVSPQLSCQKSIGDHNVVLQREVSPCYSVNISSRTHVKGLLKMCAGPCSPLAALWKWQGLRFSPLQDQVKSIKIYYSYGSALTHLSCTSWVAAQSVGLSALRCSLSCLRLTPLSEQLTILPFTAVVGNKALYTIEINQIMLKSPVCGCVTNLGCP